MAVEARSRIAGAIGRGAVDNGGRFSLWQDRIPASAKWGRDAPTFESIHWNGIFQRVNRHFDAGGSPLQYWSLPGLHDLPRI